MCIMYNYFVFIYTKNNSNSQTLFGQNSEIFNVSASGTAVF
jgi:hypothetical protein